MATSGLPPPAGLRIIAPFERFFRLEAAGSIVLMAAAAAALLWANLPGLSASYDAVWHAHAYVGVGDYALDKSVLHWVNDGLMALFFLLVGLEIKREFLLGRLSNLRAAALPIVAALGGMVVPALIYIAFNAGGAGASGWGIPMATDIAFALGAIALLGSRVPPALRVLLAAAAIVDDLGAVLVIAIFYTPQLSLGALGAAAAIFLLLAALNRFGVRSPAPYLLLGVLLWLAILKSGVHATIAGVLLAFTIPALPSHGAGAAAGHPAAGHAAARPHRTAEEAQAELVALEQAAEEEQTPLTRIEHALVPWVAFGIMPLFALANAGLYLGGDLVGALVHPVSLGILLGLVLGKQLGMTLFPWLAVKVGIAALPEGVTWRQMYGLACLGGIGFTMSLFIASLGLPPDLRDTAKLGILAASLVAGAAGTLVLIASSRKQGEVRAPSQGAK